MSKSDKEIIALAVKDIRHNNQMLQAEAESIRRQSVIDHLFFGTIGAIIGISVITFLVDFL